MSYRTINGKTGVVCDTCKRVFDAQISYADYEDLRTKFNFEIDECWRCKEKWNEFLTNKKLNTTVHRQSN